MPLDTSIPLQVQAPQITSPIQNIGGLMQLKGQMAEIALRNQQIETSKQQAADIAEQVQTRHRQNEAQSKLSTILADPANHAKIRNGDLSPLWESGASPDVVNNVAAGLSTAYEKALKLSTDQASFHATGRGLVKDAIEGIDPKDDAIAAQQFNGAMQVIGKDHPELTQGFTPLQAGPNFRQQVKDIAANNSIAHAMLVDQAAQDKTKAETSKLTADTNKANADADKTTKLLPGELTAQDRKNDQDALTLAGTSPTGITAEKQAELTETQKRDAATAANAAGHLAIATKTFNATYGPGAINQGLVGVQPHLIVPATSAYTKAGEEFATAAQVSDSMKTMLDLASKGNKAAGSNLPLVGVETLNALNGIKRINSAEIAQYGSAGSLLDKIQGRIGSIVSGQPIPQDVMNDIRALHTELDKTAKDKYANKVQVINGAYGSKFKPIELGAGADAPKMIRARDQMGKLHEAPAGTALPEGWKPE